MTTLFFSEYSEGSYYNKYLEIFNPTDSEISLDDYAFPNARNAAFTPGIYEYWNSFSDGAKITSKGFYIIAHPDANNSILEKADQTFQYLSTGNDGFKLVKKLVGATKWGITPNYYNGWDYAIEDTDFEVIDTLGDFRTFPGNYLGWEVAGINNATTDHTLIRKSHITKGNPDWEVSRGTDAENSEWIVRSNNYFDNLHQHTYDPTPVPICFPKGTPVTTDQGIIAIDKLNTDKNTIRGKEIVAITQSIPLQKHIVCFEKDALSKNVPSQQTLCSMEHKVFYKGEMMKARDIVDVCENVTFVPYNGDTLFNVLLKKEDKMMINNLICETLHPNNIMAKISTMKDEQKKSKAIKELTKIIKENNVPEYQKLYVSLM